MATRRRPLSAASLTALALLVLASCGVGGSADGDEGAGPHSSPPSIALPTGSHSGGSTTDPEAPHPDDATTTTQPPDVVQELIQDRYRDYDRLVVDLRLNDGRALRDEGSALLGAYRDLWSTKSVRAMRDSIDRLQTALEDNHPLLTAKQTSIVQEVQLFGGDGAMVVRCARFAGTERTGVDPAKGAPFEDLARITDVWEHQGGEWRLVSLGWAEVDADVTPCRGLNYTR